MGNCLSTLYPLGFGMEDWAQCPKPESHLGPSPEKVEVWSEQLKFVFSLSLHSFLSLWSQLVGGFLFFPLKLFISIPDSEAHWVHWHNDFSKDTYLVKKTNVSQSFFLSRTSLAFANVWEKEYITAASPAYNVNRQISSSPPISFESFSTRPSSTWTSRLSPGISGFSTVILLF